MKQFMDKDFLLTNEVAKELFLMSQIQCQL